MCLCMWDKRYQKKKEQDFDVQIFYKYIHIMEVLLISAFYFIYQ